MVCGNEVSKGGRDLTVVTSASVFRGRMTGIEGAEADWSASGLTTSWKSFARGRGRREADETGKQCQYKMHAMRKLMIYIEAEAPAGQALCRCRAGTVD